MRQVLNDSHASGRSATELLALVLALCFLWSAVAIAQDPASDSAASEIGVIENDITASTSKQAAIIRTMTGALKAKEEASSRLVELARVASEQELAVEKIAKRMASLQADNAAALLELAQKRQALGTLLAGLQNLSQNPPPALIVAPDDVTGALRGAMLFAAVIPDMRAEADKVKLALASVEAIRRALEAEQQKAEVAIHSLEATKASITQSIIERQAAALTSAKALGDERAKAKSLAERALNLRELIAGLAQKRESEALALETTLRNAPDFLLLKGQLELPVQGRLIAGFGENAVAGPKQLGQRFAASPGAQVLSPVLGRVEFAGQYLNYGQLVIVNPGRGYLVLLSGMHNISVEIGQSVRAREPLGEMEPSTAVATLENVNNSSLTNHRSPVLYVEFRKRNEPIDPSPWWKNGGSDMQAKVGTQ